MYYQPKECLKTIMQGNHRSPEPAFKPSDHPRNPALRRVVVKVAARGGLRRRQRLAHVIGGRGRGTGGRDAANDAAATADAAAPLLRRRHRRRRRRGRMVDGGKVIARGNGKREILEVFHRRGNAIASQTLNRREDFPVEHVGDDGTIVDDFGLLLLMLLLLLLLLTGRRRCGGTRREFCLRVRFGRFRSDAARALIALGRPLADAAVGRGADADLTFAQTTRAIVGITDAARPEFTRRRRRLKRGGMRPAQRRPLSDGGVIVIIVVDIVVFIVLIAVVSFHFSAGAAAIRHLRLVAETVDWAIAAHVHLSID